MAPRHGGGHGGYGGVLTVTMATPNKEEGRDLRVRQALLDVGIAMETVPYYERGRRNGMAGLFCKNLLLKDRWGQFYLVICLEDKSLDLKALKQELKAHRNFSFSTAEELWSLLGCESGAVSPLGVIHDLETKVKVILDDALLECRELLNFHPLDQSLTTLLSIDDLLKFLRHFKHQPTFVNIKDSVQNYGS